jgi:hypothetical protein
MFGVFSLNYVARELEMPFGADANDLPLIEFQDHMNKSLLMLIRQETDHVPHLGETYAATHDELLGSICVKRPKHFLHEQNHDMRISIPDIMYKNSEPTPPPPVQVGSAPLSSANLLGSTAFEKCPEEALLKVAEDTMAPLIEKVATSLQASVQPLVDQSFAKLVKEVTEGFASLAQSSRVLSDRLADNAHHLLMHRNVDNGNGTQAKGISQWTYASPRSAANVSEEEFPDWLRDKERCAELFALSEPPAETLFPEKIDVPSAMSPEVIYKAR